MSSKLSQLLIGAALTLIPLRFIESAITPEEPVDLLNDPTFSNFTYHLWPERSLTDERAEIWNIDSSGLMNISGKGWGYLRTKSVYRDYHLVLEYQWGEHTVGFREDRARDNGLFVHAFGPDGILVNSWISSIEAQLIEGGSGDILVLAATDEDGKKAPTKVTATVRLDRDGEPVWSAGGAATTYPPADKPASRINWSGRDPDWTDVKGFRGSDDIENPVREWNRMEVICRNDTIQILINGELVNEVFDVFPSEGYVCIQSEGAELWVRRFELWPLDSFQEPWQVEAASNDTGASETGESLLPRREPWSPERSQAAWRIDGDYEIQLVAAEPVVNDPVDVVWDAEGRMYVAEMRDYPFPPEIGGNLSRIRLLHDEDNDGRMDKATTWADNLDHVQGLTPYRDGLIATTRTAILYLRDTDGDDRADYMESLYTSSDPRHSQLQVSSGRWGLDNAIYFNNGLDTREIYPTESAGEVLSIRGWDLRYDPREESLARVTGRGQYGASIDDWGRRFFTSNRNPIMYGVMTPEVLERNPFAAITKGYEDIHPSAAPLRPFRVSHTTAAAHLGTFTAACGTGVYRGDRMPELKGDIFVCDPTGQLITRNRLVVNGASFETERVGEPYEFIVSEDEWTRPVQMRNGPDGSLYICDMYRRFIDHAIFFPDAFLDSHYMRAGLDHGRIWRLVRKGKTPEVVRPLPKENQELVKLLESNSGWHRTHAQRLLVERQAIDTVPLLKQQFRRSDSALGRLHALWTLEGLGELTADDIAFALGDTAPGVIGSAIELADPDGNFDALAGLALGENERLQYLALVALGSSSLDRTDIYEHVLLEGGLSEYWIRKAILSAGSPRSALLVLASLKAFKVSQGNGAVLPDGLDSFIKEFVAETVAREDREGVGLIVSEIDPSNIWEFDISIVEGLSRGLKRSASGGVALGAFAEDPPKPLTRAELSGVREILGSVEKIALDRSRGLSERLAALALVEEQGEDVAFRVAKALVDKSEGPDLQLAACQMLAGENRQKVADFFFEGWNSLGPTARREALELIASNEDTGYLLMQRMRDGFINPSLMPPFRRWWLERRERVEIATLAKELFGGVNDDRRSVIQEYVAALPDYVGDSSRGREVFVKAACVTCHRLDGMGFEVGPSIADVRIKPTEALLTDILDPHRAVEERWAVYTVELQGGQSFMGIIASETTSTVELTLPNGQSESVARDQIVKLESGGGSLMPVGLEAVISKAEMADLIAFLKTPHSSEL